MKFSESKIQPTSNFFILAFIFSLSFSFLFSSCKKDEEDPKDDKQESYYPFTTGSTWTYQDQDNSTTTITLTSQTQSIEGSTWNVISFAPEQLDIPSFMRIDATTKIVYRAFDFRNNGGIFLIEPVTDLDAKVGDTWTQNNEQNGVSLNVKNTLLEKDVQKTVNGKSYDKVMVVKSELTSNFFDNTNSTLYFAAGIGLIAEEFEDGDYSRLTDYSIK